MSADIAQQDVDLQIINGQSNDDILHGHELMQFAEAVARRDHSALQTSRHALLEAAGNQVLVDTAAAAGNFQRLVRIADATSIPVDGSMNALNASITEELDLHRFASAKHTPKQNTLRKLVGVPVRFLLPRVVRAGKH